MITPEDKKFMRMALALARKGEGRTSPNPAVGAVLVRDGVVIGEGFHKKAGTPHAEVNALSSVRGDTSGATLYVTLEPCNHYGRTPPCTKAILEAGISRVVIGALDPNPRVEGGGAGHLRRHGIAVDTGCNEDECRRLIAPFAKHARTGLPWVRAKVACSMDGRVATRTGHARWITNERARAFGHRLRGISDAILVGKRTILFDDPELTCRAGSLRGKNPVRVVLDSSLSLDPSRYTIFRPDTGARTLVIGSETSANPRAIPTLERTGADVLLVRGDKSGRIHLPDLLPQLSSRGIQSLLVEGGASVHGSLFDHKLVDEAFFFYAPIVIGGEGARPAVGGYGAETVNDASRLSVRTIRRLGDNWLVHGYLADIRKLFEEEDVHGDH